MRTLVRMSKWPDETFLHGMATYVKPTAESNVITTIKSYSDLSTYRNAA